MIAESSGRRLRINQQVSELGSGRSRRSGFPTAMLCVRVDSRGMRPFARAISIISRRARRDDFYQCIEWAGVQPWSQRQGRPQRHLLLRHEPVAGGLAAAAASHGDVRLGRRRRLVPRHRPIMAAFFRRSGPTGTTCRSRRVQYGLGERGPRSVVTGELVCGDETLSDERTARATAAISATIFSPIRSTTTITRRARRLGQGHGAVPVGRQLGRSGSAPARQFRGFRPRCVDGEMAGGAWPRALDAFLHRLWTGASETLLRSFPQGRETMAGPSSRKCSCRSVTSTASSGGMRTSGRCPHGVDEVLPAIPATRRCSLTPPADNAEISFAAMGDGLTFMSRRWPRRPRSPARWRPSCSNFFEHRGRRYLRGVPRFQSRPARGGFAGRDRSAYAGRARLAARLASQARSNPVAAVSSLPQP